MSEGKKSVWIDEELHARLMAIKENEGIEIKFQIASAIELYLKQKESVKK